MTYKEYESIVRERLSDKRFYHCQCVAKCAASLAERYGADRDKARLAGILHDITKELSAEEQLKILERFDIILSKTERENPKLWHSASGAAYIEHVLGVDDREVLDAVRCHTGGRAGMTLLDKVIFIADFVSDDREYPGIERMRKKARRSLEEAMLEGIEFTVNELLKDRAPIAGEMIDAYNEALGIFKASEKKERNRK